MDPALLISIVNTAVAVIGGAFGVITYSKNQTLKRQEIILPLMSEFDTNKTLDSARTLLDGFALAEKGSGSGQYDFESLSIYLRDHRQSQVSDLTEIEIRNSFTALLDFFAKLGYLMDIGVIRRRDLGYFEYYISKASFNPAIISFTIIYKFELYAVLLDKMDLIPSVLEHGARDYYRRNKKSIF